MNYLKIQEATRMTINGKKDRLKFGKDHFKNDYEFWSFVTLDNKKQFF